MYVFWGFEDLRRSTAMHPAVPVCYRYYCRDDGLAAAFAQAELDRYRRDGTDLSEQS